MALTAPTTLANYEDRSAGPVHCRGGLPVGRAAEAQGVNDLGPRSETHGTSSGGVRACFLDLVLSGRSLFLGSGAGGAPIELVVGVAVGPAVSRELDGFELEGFVEAGVFLAGGGLGL